MTLQLNLEKWTNSAQQTAHLLLIDFTIELIYFEPPRSGHGLDQLLCVEKHPYKGLFM